MEYRISFNYIEKSKFRNLLQWAFSYSSYRFLSGFKLRIFGLHINIREYDSLKKLIKVHDNAK